MLKSSCYDIDYINHCISVVKHTWSVIFTTAWLERVEHIFHLNILANTTRAQRTKRIATESDALSQQKVPGLDDAPDRVDADDDGDMA